MEKQSGDILNKYIELICLTLRIKRCGNFNNYFYISYSTWSKMLKYIIQSECKLTVRIIFDMMVKRGLFKLHKFRRSSYYVFDYFNKFNEYTKPKIRCITWSE